MPTEKYAHAPGDPRALPAHRQAVRPLRQRAVPHRGHRPRVGRRATRAGSSAPTAATSSPPSSSAMGTGPLHVPKLPGHPRHRDVPRATRSTPAAGTTTTPAATRPARRWTSSPTSGSRSSAPAPPRCSACRTWRRACQELYVFQRTPSSVDVRDNRPTDPEWFAEHRDAGLAAALARELHRQPDRRAAPTRTWCRTAGPTSRAASASKIMALPPEEFTPERHAGAPSRTPTSRRWRRSAPGSTRSSRTPTTAREPQGLVPPALQAALLPRRVPAGLQPARARTSSTPTARASSASPRRGVVVGGRRVRGRLHHLRLRLRGRHASTPGGRAST